MIVRYGVSSLRLKELADFVDTIGEFTQYLGANQYYGDNVNKKVALLNVDAQAAALEIEELIVRAGALRDETKKTILAKKKFSKTSGAGGDGASFSKCVNDFEKRVLALNARALALTRELRSEFGKKGFCASV